MGVGRFIHYSSDRFPCILCRGDLLLVLAERNPPCCGIRLPLFSSRVSTRYCWDDVVWPCYRGCHIGARVSAFWKFRVRGRPPAEGLYGRRSTLQSFCSFW